MGLSVRFQGCIFAQRLKKKKKLEGKKHEGKTSHTHRKNHDLRTCMHVRVDPLDSFPCRVVTCCARPFYVVQVRPTQEIHAGSCRFTRLLPGSMGWVMQILQIKHPSSLKDVNHEVGNRWYVGDLSYVYHIQAFAFFHIRHCATWNNFHRCSPTKKNIFGICMAREPGSSSE